MRRLSILTVLLLISANASGLAAERVNTIRERQATVQLTRLPSARLWWNDQNRVIGAAFKGIDATDHAMALVSQLPQLRTLVLLPLPENQLTDRGMRHLAEMPQLELLSISGSRVTDAGLVWLSGLSSLRALILNGPFNDPALVVISQLAKLEMLNLTQTNVTDEGMSQLASLGQLNTLVLNGTDIHGSGLAAVAEMKGLRRLYLSDTAVDDGAVGMLAGMTHLESLVILNTGITTAGVEQLRAGLSSDCEIVHDSGTVRGTADLGLDLARSRRPTSLWRSSR